MAIDPRRTRRPRRFAPAAFGLLLLLSAPLVAAAQATPEAATPAVSASGELTPATPAGDQLRWILDQLNSDPAALTDAEIAARFSDAILAQVPPPQVRDLLV